MTAITAAIRADAATSDAEGRAQAAEMITTLTIGALAETVTRLNESEDRALRLEEKIGNAVTAREAFAKSFSNALADLNATRERLTAAEAFRDSLQAEVDGLRVERDAQQADLVGLHCAAAERDTVRELHKSACAERDALRAEVDKLRARPVLTEAAVRLAITSKRTGEEAVRIGIPATIYAQLTEGGAVTLPETPAHDTEGAARRHARSSTHAGYWPPSFGSTIDGVDADIMGAMLRASGPVAIDDVTLLAMSRSAVEKLDAMNAKSATPSKPADVFAGVSIDELMQIRHDAFYACNCQAGSGRSCCSRAGITAVLDALRVKLVAPVDTEEVARDYMERVVPGLYDACKSPSLHFSSMRLALEAAGIPVTPEAGK